MSSQACSQCPSTTGLMSRHAGKLFCSKCMFQITQSQMAASAHQIPPAPPQSSVVLKEQTGEKLEELGDWRALRQQVSQVEAGEEPVEEEKDREETLPVILCEPHSRPAQSLCFCNGISKAYLCSECFNPHCRIFGLKHEPLPIEVDEYVSRPEDVAIYEEKRILLKNVEELRKLLHDQKRNFDETLNFTLEALKNMMELKFAEIASEADAYAQGVEIALETASFELKNWKHDESSFSETTKLLIHQIEVSPDTFIFFNFRKEYDQAITFEVREAKGPDKSFQSFLQHLRELCKCSRCEHFRTVFGLPKATPWKCFSCQTERKLELTCMNCGCGPNWADFLSYKEVELRENSTKWVCKNCEHENLIEVRICGQCSREAGKPKKKSLLSPFIPSFFKQ